MPPISPGTIIKQLLKQFNDSLPNKPKNNVDDGKTVGEEKRGFFDKFKL